MKPVRAFARCRSGATMAEFAMVLPLLLLFVFGIIDVGRAMWIWNRAEKATQMGARFAVATAPVANGLVTYSFVTDGGLVQGAPIAEADFAGASCTSAGCECLDEGACPWLGTFSSAAFSNIVDRMQAIMPEIAAANVAVDYEYSGLGYAGDPNGPDAAPLVTVRLQGLQFQPITLLLFGASLTMPDFRTTLTLEDGAGAIAN